jgi:hypothetical protein
MVLLCNDSDFNIHKHHILKCLNKKRDNFKISITLETDILKNENEDIKNENITYDDISNILNSKDNSFKDRKK